MLLLLLELLQSNELPELAIGGAWLTVDVILQRGSDTLVRIVLEADICTIAAAHLRAIGPAADWIVSLYHLKHGRRHCTWTSVNNVHVRVVIC